ncbi:RNA polymerase sigma factor [Streptomyces hiroshimensis]|uniref:RNA polymerase sigma factor n=1 Tax=Streptomyces hiroshimensis TaxID=66424 RepID=UPI001674C815|nr:sigma-70 family RNA polymerase sigma factor [Streptomyces hiroshimensis]
MTGLPADYRAFHELYRGIYIHWAELYLRHRHDAEEAVDQAFEELYLAWHEVLSQESPNAYAWAVVRHRTVDTARARGRRPAVIDTAAFETTALHHALDPIGELEHSLAVYDAIHALPERQHDVIVLLHVLGHSTREVASIMGITPAGVRSAARFARHRLQHSLGLDQGPSGDEGGTDR